VLLANPPLRVNHRLGRAGCTRSDATAPPTAHPVSENTEPDLAIGGQKIVISESSKLKACSPFAFHAATALVSKGTGAASNSRATAPLLILAVAGLLH
jgi:hypothetical protein